MRIDHLIKNILLLSLILSSQSCSDIPVVHTTERYISDDEIVSSMHSILRTEAAYVQPTLFLNPNSWVDYLRLDNITDVCNMKVDTTFATTIDETDIKLDAESELFFNLVCNEKGLPSSFSYNGASEGFYAADQLSGTFLQASSYVAEIELVEGNLTMSGSTGQSGSMKIAIANEDQVVNTTIRFVLNELSIGFFDKEVKRGSAKAELKFQGTHFVETYIANINYLGDNKITIKVNGEIYNIDLSE